MNLPSFMWLWRIAAWSMGLAIMAYLVLAVSGGIVLVKRRSRKARPKWLRPLHYSVGVVFVILLLILLSIGIVGTLGEFGKLGHSIHMPVGLSVVALSLGSAWSSTRMSARRPWARPLHVWINVFLFFDMVAVGLSGLAVVQKYLP
ncbi:MAG: DUF4079 domain-containing protein [Cyanobacteria bacterium P01_F01_bin.150]